LMVLWLHNGLPPLRYESRTHSGFCSDIAQARGRRQNSHMLNRMTCSN
jgi:hypothetical protein